MKTPVHLSIGEEAICAGVCLGLASDDQLVGTYRSHGIYLARTLETDKFFAELYGKVSGISRGKAGSMHLSNREHGFLGSSAVVGTTIPVAAGAALSNKLRGERRVVATFFGDGAIDEGVFFETLNFAALKRLRVLFVCEDNGLAIHSPAIERHGYDNIARIVRQFRCDVYESESTVAADIYDLTREALVTMRETSRPAFMHLKYCRYKEHVGPGEDFQAGYRSKSEYEAWLERDPVVVQRLLAVRETSRERVVDLEQRIDAQIAQSITLAEQADFPAPGDLYTHVLSPRVSA